MRISPLLPTSMVDRHQIESWAHDPLKALVQVTFLLTLKHKIMEKHEVFIGVDVSKSKLDVSVVLGSDRQLLYHQVYQNNKKGIDRIFLDIRKRTGVRQASWLFCMEHSGVYAMPLAYSLSEMKYDYALVPAIAIQRSLGMKRGKNDKADSLDIARYACIHGPDITLYQLPESSLMKLKLLLGHRDRLIGSRKMFITAGKETGDFLDSSIASDVVNSSNSVIKTLSEEIKLADRQIMELIRSDEKLSEAYDLATSVPGVGPQTVCHLMVHTRCFTSFDNARQLACYVGVAPFEYSSGSSIRGKTRVSHMANKKLKSLVSMGALNAARFDAEMRQYYQRKVGEGKNAMLVMNAVRNKLLARVFATVKRGTPYVPMMKFAA